MSQPIKFQDAVNKAIEEQVIPRIFSAAQIDEMHLPFHEKNDHYSFTSVKTSEESFEKFYNIRPQLMIGDLRISDLQLAAAPKSIKVTFEGKTHDIPLRIYRYNREKNVQEWQKNLEFSYVSREGIEKLEPRLKQKFNLVSKADYWIGYGVAIDRKDTTRTKTEPCYLVQLWTEKARKQEASIKKYIEDQLPVITPGRPSQVKMLGPLFPQ